MVDEFVQRDSRILMERRFKWWNYQNRVNHTKKFERKDLGRRQSRCNGVLFLAVESGMIRYIIITYLSNNF